MVKEDLFENIINKRRLDMADVIVIGILLVVVIAALRYIYKEKKRGSKCIGCSAAGSCSGSCGCHSDK